jgi:hypothetical protein
MEHGSRSFVVLVGALGGSISGALALGCARVVSARLHAPDPADVISNLLGGPLVVGFTIGALAGGIAGILLGLVTISAARLLQRLIFAFAMCPAASLCIDVWVLARAVPFASILIGSWVYAACVACLLPRSTEM